MKLRKNLLCIALAAAILSLSLTVYASGGVKKTITATLNGVNLLINGKVLAVEGKSFTNENGKQVPNTILYQNTLYVPLKTLANACGLTTSWDGKNNATNIKTNGLSTDKLAKIKIYSKIHMSISIY